MPHSLYFFSNCFPSLFMAPSPVPLVYIFFSFFLWTGLAILLQIMSHILSYSFSHSFSLLIFFPFLSQHTSIFPRVKGPPRSWRYTTETGTFAPNVQHVVEALTSRTSTSILVHSPPPVHSFYSVIRYHLFITLSLSLSYSLHLS